MLINDHLQDIESRLGNGEFMRPDYAKYSFRQIPALVELLLRVHSGDHPFGKTVLDRVSPNPKNVVTLMIDGFGYNQWLKYGEQHPFLNRVLERGNLMPITALFPSTTSASVTTINSGLTPQEHGLMEWNLYMRELDEIITTLPFMSMRKDAQPDELAGRGVDASILFDGTSLHTRLKNNGIASHVVLRDSYAQSAYSKVSQAGADVISYSSSSDMMVLLRNKLASVQGKAYFYVYWDAVDHMCHVHEPHSECYLAELNSFTHMLQTEFLDKVDCKTAEETVLLVTADHGHVPMYPDQTIYLNDIPELEEMLAVSLAGKTIYPYGSPRDVFLQVKEDRLDDALELLSKQLSGKATVQKSQEEADKGLFGIGNEHPEFRHRIGNVLILPHENQTVWYQHSGHDRSKLRGMHGGMSREEMLTVLGFANLSDLL